MGLITQQGLQMYQQPLGHIVELFLSTEESSLRTSQDTIFLDNRGIIGDKFYNKNIERSVLLTSTQSYKLAEKNHISLSYGTLGENILMDYNPYHLHAGTRLKIGSVILQISQYCTICNHLSAVDPVLPTLLANDRGIFSKVVQAGEIKKNDKIFLLVDNQCL